MPKAPASGRAYEHATISMGLVNIPVSVFTGTVSGHGIKRGMFTVVTKDDGTEEHHPVGYGNIDKITGELVPAGQPVIKKVATEYGDVFVEDHEVEHLFNLSPKSITIKSFQPLSLFHRGVYVPKSLYYVEADKITQGKKKIENKPAQQSLALIFKAMREEGVMAVVEFTTRGTPKPAVLLADGTLWVVYHTDELREQRPLPEIDLPEAAVEQGRMLIKAMSSTEPLDLTDERTALIQGFADEKAQAGDFTRTVEVDAPAAPAASDDLMAMLQASVEQAKANRAAS